MAKSSTSIKKGQVLNPGGRAKLPEDLKLLMRTTSEQMKRDICEVYAMDLRLLLTMETEGLSAGRAALMSCLNNSFQSGDFKALNVILDRVLGKIPEAPLGPEEETLDHSKDETINQLVSLIVKERK